MKISDNQPKFIVINKRANSLYSLISDGKYRSTSLGRETWKSLIGSEASLQDNSTVTGKDLTPIVTVKKTAKQESVSFLTMKTNANPVIPGSGLVLVDIPTTPTHVEMKH